MAKRKDTHTKIPILRQHIRGNLGRKELLDDLERWSADKSIVQNSTNKTNMGKLILT